MKAAIIRYFFRGGQKVVGTRHEGKQHVSSVCHNMRV
jgi:hypothetical protein